MTLAQAVGELKRTSSFAVLLAAYNGAAYLDEQIDSIARQDVERIDLFVSDDGSTDNTLEVVERWQRSWTKGAFHLFKGPGAGVAAENFRSLALRPEVDTDYVAFSDQDDIWDADKLSQSAGLVGLDDGPAVAAGRTRIVDETGQLQGQSPLFSRPPSFNNALLQNIGGGNTMLLSRPAFELFRESCRRTSFVAHDWWVYLMVSGAGGVVRYDPVPHLSYRQHRNNLVGANRGVRPALKRLRHLATGGYADWTTRNAAALALCDDLLTPGARAALRELQTIKALRGPAALQQFRQSGLYRQSPRDNLTLGVAAMFGKL